jgi:hypothetical protein
MGAQPPLLRVKVLCQRRQLSRRHRQHAITARRSQTLSSQAAIPLRYCFPLLALADARHLQRLLFPDAPLSAANLAVSLVRHHVRLAM